MHRNSQSESSLSPPDSASTSSPPTRQFSGEKILESIGAFFRGLNPQNWVPRQPGTSQKFSRRVAIATVSLITILSVGYFTTQEAEALLFRFPVYFGAQTVTSPVVGTTVSHPIIPLSQVPVPKPSSLSTYVKNESEAIRLGKTLFWDLQIGSDGFTSCATCHFHAGVDPRSKNHLGPGPDGRIDKGVNAQLAAADFPFHLLSDPNNRQSSVTRDTNDIKGGTGVFKTQFNNATPGQPKDNETPIPDLIFRQNGVNVRQVTGREVPTMINAVFNHRNFWDGRAQNIFNGQSPFGLRDANARVLQSTGPSSVQAVKIQIDNSSLASQAVGPPLSNIEPSAEGRKFFDIGKRLSQVVPLSQQVVAFDDSVLGSIANSTASSSVKGLKTTYPQMIRNAFQDRWWNADVIVTLNPDNSITTRPRNGQTILADREYSMMDYNFALYYGLALQAYMTTLISDQAPIDRFASGTTSALTTQQRNGKALFEGKAKCISCHNGGEIAGGTYTNILSANPKELLEKMIVGDGGQAVYDNGFYNTGVRPTAEDLGVGGLDPFGNPLSNTRLAQQGKLKALTGDDPNTSVTSSTRVVADGAFKTPSLRNIELTAPYFHNGGTLTLKQVVQFYNRGGDRRKLNDPSTSIPASGFKGSGQNCSLEGTAKSVISSTPLSLTFTNNSGRNLNLYWLDLTGRRISYGTIANGQSRTQPTFETHPWLLADATNNNSCVYLVPDALDSSSSGITLNGIGQQECDTTGFGNNCSNLDADIERLGLNDSEMNDIVEFMKSLTDDRVRFDRAPFDHPSLLIHNGHPNPITDRGNGTAPDDTLLLAAVGRNGYSTPSPGFLEPLNSVLTPATAPQYEVWTTCAVENQFCAFSGTRKLRYGANGQFVIKNITNGTACTNAIFGSDPAPTIQKQCQYSDAVVAGGGTTAQFTFCAAENGFCSFSGTTQVRYGANGTYSTKTLTNGTACTNAIFGDPVPTVAKSCEYDTSQTSAAAWTTCSNEYEVCSFPGTKTVRYGANGRYLTKVFTGSTDCNNTVFGGDPAPGVVKVCEYQ